MLIGIFSVLWFIRQAKIIFFYIYLWQLKEYHLGRFLAHFDTEKGKKLLFDKLVILKIALLLIFPISQNAFLFSLVGLYALEGIWFLKGFLQGKAKRPILTLKTALLISGLLVVQVFLLFIVWISKANPVKIALVLLFFDIFLPVIISLFVLFLEPLTIFLEE